MPDPFLTQLFLFDWNGGSQPKAITAQCETIQVRWGGAGGNISLPYPPYSFSIYTSIHDTPIILSAGSETSANLTIPFTPGTMYEICMFDSRGSTGGCQDVYTVYQALSTPGPSCENWTTPEPLKVRTDRGRYAWVDQCDIIRLDLVDGQEPYQFSVQPALYPPLNISGITGHSFEWKNILGRTTSFFLTIVDANGRMWTQGPMYSGKGKTSCLDYDNPDKVTFSSIGLLAGLGAGILILGWILLALLYLLFRNSLRCGGRRHNPQPADSQQIHSAANGIQSNEAVNRVSSRQSGTSQLHGCYEITPFVPSSTSVNLTRELTRERVTRRPSTGNLGSNWQNDRVRQPSQVAYVMLHQDRRLPTTGGNTDRIEHPPGYSAFPPPLDENTARRTT